MVVSATIMDIPICKFWQDWNDFFCVSVGKKLGNLLI